MAENLPSVSSPLKLILIIKNTRLITLGLTGVEVSRNYNLTVQVKGMANGAIIDKENPPIGEPRPANSELFHSC